MLRAKPKKLRTGKWGMIVESDEVRPGDAVRVFAASGSVWRTTVDRVLWCGNGITVCTSQHTANQRLRAKARPMRGRFS